MSTSAWIMFVVGAGIIWGGLVVSLFVAVCQSNKTAQQRYKHKFIK